MYKVINCSGKGISIGAYYTLPGRKKPALCVQKDNIITVYGSFIDEARADAFMDELRELVGAVSEPPKEGCS